MNSIKKYLRYTRAFTRSHAYRSFFAVMLSLYAVSEMSLSWIGANKESLTLLTPVNSDEISQCIASGFQMRYQIELKLCGKVQGWFAECGGIRKEIRTIEFDDIAEGYRFFADSIGDGKEGTTRVYGEREHAIAALSTLENIALDSLMIPDSNGTIPNDMSVVNVRIISECNGGYNETLARMTYLLSLGLVSLHEADSGWVRFALNETNTLLTK
jgi:hypothetical protein